MFKSAAASLNVDPDTVAAAVLAMTDVMLEAARVRAWARGERRKPSHIPHPPLTPPLPLQHNLSQQEFTGSLGDVTMPEECKRNISEFYSSNLRPLRDRLGASAGPGAGAGAGVGAPPSLPEYRGLDWRLEVKVASRHAHDRMQPAYTLRLDTAAPGLPGAKGGDDGAAGGGSGRSTASASASGGPASVVFTADFETLQRALDAVDEAAAEMKTGHSKRVLRYIR